MSNVNADGVRIVGDYSNRINKVVAMVRRNGSEEDGNKVLAGLYLAFGVDEAVLNDILDNKADINNVVQALNDVENDFANVGVQVR